MDIILCFLLPMLATIPMAGMICRIRIARKKPISYGTLLISACSIPLLIAFIAACVQPDIWWSRDKMTPEIFLSTLGYLVAMCVLPALGVVVYYQRRSKKHNTVV